MAAVSSRLLTDISSKEYLAFTQLESPVQGDLVEKPLSKSVSPVELTIEAHLGLHAGKSSSSPDLVPNNYTQTHAKSVRSIEGPAVSQGTASLDHYLLHKCARGILKSEVPGPDYRRGPRMLCWASAKTYTDLHTAVSTF